MLRDYELALSNYRLLSTDYKLDKAWKRYAGVQVKIYIFFMEFLYGYFPFKVLVFGLGTSAIYIHGCEFSLYKVSEWIIIFEAYKAKLSFEADTYTFVDIISGINLLESNVNHKNAIRL